MPRRDFVDALRGIAAKNKFDFKALSHDWIIQISDAASGKKCTVFGYTFDINPAGAVDVCKEKSATSLVLDSCGVANIPHRVFLNPSHPFAKEFVPRTGMWAGIQAFVQEFGFPVVLKPLKGTGGHDVIKCACQRDLEAAVQQLHSQEHGLAVSPYKRLKDEYRCVVLDNKVELVYRKVRPHVMGDGTSTVAALIGRRLVNAVATQEAACAASAANELSPAELVRVPRDGEAVLLQWRHNLGQGAVAEMDVPVELQTALTTIALTAVAAIGVRFCSVDIADVQGEGLMVMEVNSGVMMDTLMGQLGEGGVALATRLYETAVLRALGLSGENDEPATKQRKLNGD